MQGAEGVGGVAAPVVAVAHVEPLKEDVGKIGVVAGVPGGEAGLEVAIDVGEVVGQVALGRFVSLGIGGEGVEVGAVMGVVAQRVFEVEIEGVPFVVGEFEFGGDVTAFSGGRNFVEDGGGGVKGGEGFEDVGQPGVAVADGVFEEDAEALGGGGKGLSGGVGAEGIFGHVGVRLM